MELYIIILIIVLIISILLLMYFISYNKLKKYKDRMVKSEEKIDEYLSKKLEIIIEINNELKKATGKKDYLKDYVNLDNSIISNIEKDLKLTEAESLINNIVLDFNLTNNNDIKKVLVKLRETNELLTSAKNMFNTNALASNNALKTFPNNVISKFGGFSQRSFYTNNKTDDGETI